MPLQQVDLTAQPNLHDISANRVTQDYRNKRDQTNRRTARRAAYAPTALFVPCAALLFLCVPVVAQAGDRHAVPAAPAGQPDLIFTLRGGIAATPNYFGSNEYSFGPDIGFRINYTRLPDGRTFGSTDANNPRYGFRLRGSFRHVGARKPREHPELAGLDEIGQSFEVGLGLEYTSYRFDVFADLRYGVIGHESFLGELGSDVKFHASDRLTFSMGPRVLVGSDDYASDHFGVSAAETTAGYAGGTHDASGGILSAGVELGAAYRFNDYWGVEGALTWNRFTGDAASSPFIKAGERDQYGVRIGITRRFVLDL